jgi:hypothetical protein
MAGIGALIWFFGGVLTAPLFGALEPLGERTAQEAWASYPVNLPVPSALIDLRYRKLIKPEQYRELMKKQGYNEEWAEKLYRGAERLLSAEELISAKWRGILKGEEFKAYMEKLGLTEDDIKIAEQVRKPIPSATDIVRFAVRDVYTPEIVKKYGYDEYPEGFWDAIGNDLERTGMDKADLEKYWEAHWELPSPMQGYEFLHRLQPEVLEKLGKKYEEMGLDPKKLETDLKTLDELLRVADYPSYWRERLEAISFRPLTRVDLRRIYALGIIDDEELVLRFMELGYTRKDAELMLEFYKKYKNRTEKDLTRAQVLKGYVEGLITRNETKSYLIDLGYDENESEFLIKLEEWKDRERKIKDKVRTLRVRYVKGDITIEDVRKELTALDLPLATIDYFVDEIENARMRAIKLPSKDDLKKWLKNKIITEEEFKSYMKLIGYREKEIELFLRELT